MLLPARRARVGAGLACLCVAGAARPAEGRLAVARVVVDGADKTDPAVVRAWLGLDADDPITFEALAAARDRLLDSGLFSSAEVTVDLPRERAVRAMYLTEPLERVDVRVRVREKHSWFVVPNAFAGAGERRIGVLYGDANLIGSGATLAAAGQLGARTSYLSATFRNPLVRRWPVGYALGAGLRREDFRFYEDHRLAQTVPTRVVGAELRLDYRFSDRVAIRGGATLNQVEVGEPTLLPERPLPYNPRRGRQLYLALELAYRDLASHDGLPVGTAVALDTHAADPLWGSQFGYDRLEFSLVLHRRAWRVYPSLDAGVTLVDPTSAAGVPLTQTARAGGANLRGYFVDEFRGDLRVTVQGEAQVPVARLRRWGGWIVTLAGFADLGAVIERHPGGRLQATQGRGRPDLEDLHVGVGGGARLVARGVAIPAVQLDVGYGIDVRDLAITVAIAAER